MVHLENPYQIVKSLIYRFIGKNLPSGKHSSRVYKLMNCEIQ